VLNMEIDYIKRQIISKYNPQGLILFGSCARGLVRQGSDIDLCVVMDTGDKRQVSIDMLLELDYDTAVDIIVYTPEEWQKYKDDEATFPGLVNRTGVKLIG